MMAINIAHLKENFILNYPNHKLCGLLKNTPNELTPEEFLMLSRICIKILNEK
jgi:hypothetical protein